MVVDEALENFDVNRSQRVANAPLELARTVVRRAPQTVWAVLTFEGKCWVSGGTTSEDNGYNLIRHFAELSRLPHQSDSNRNHPDSLHGGVPI